MWSFKKLGFTADAMKSFLKSVVKNVMCLAYYRTTLELVSYSIVLHLRNSGLLAVKINPIVVI